MNRVLHLINGEHYAGAERVQDLLGLRLPQFGFQVGYACVKPDQFSGRRAAVDAPLYETRMSHRVDLRPALALASLVRRHGYDLIHSHTPRTALVGSLAARLAGVPLVHHAHGQTLTEVGRRWISRASAAVERLSLTASRRILAVSPSVVEYLAGQGIDRQRVRLVPNGVPALPVRPPRAGGPTWTLGTIALFRPRKGTEMLLAATSELRRRGFDVRLRAVGGFETKQYETEVKSRARELGLADHVDWVGFSRDVSGELRHIDLMVLPSLLAEGLPMVVIEAMAAGVPPVGTRVDGITDVIRHEVDGLLCEPQSESIAAQVTRVITGELDWQRLSTAAVERHRECYSDEMMARRVADVYREILSGSCN